MANPLAKMMGPLPMWGWLAAGGGGLALSFYMSREERAAAESMAQPDPTIGPPFGATQGALVVPSETVVSAPMRTNAQWERRAVSYLVSIGVGATNAARAIGRYLGGIHLSPEDWAIVDQAITQLGMPPEGAPAPQPEVTEPAPQPTPVPTAYPKLWTGFIGPVTYEQELGHAQKIAAVRQLLPPKQDLQYARDFNDPRYCIEWQAALIARQHGYKLSQVRGTQLSTDMMLNPETYLAKYGCQ